jgi:hypothetical protein
MSMCAMTVLPMDSTGTSLLMGTTGILASYALSPLCERAAMRSQRLLVYRHVLVDRFAEMIGFF